MKFRLFFIIMILTTIHQSFSMTLEEQKNLNFQLLLETSRGNKREVASLVQRGADVNATDNGKAIGNTPLHQAAYQGSTTIVELLLSKGANSNAKNHLATTPLHLAANTGNTATVKLLLSYDADINAKDNKGNTPLHAAALKGHAAIAELLVSRGADVNAKDIFGKTPLHQAKLGTATTVELLKKYQALLEQAKNPTKALLKVAIEHRYYSLVKLLLQRGIKPEIRDLQLAKAKWQTAEYKKPYEAIGHLLVAYLQLLGELKTPEKSKKNQAMGSLKRLKAYFRLSTPGASSMQGPISKTGIVGLYGLTEGIAQNIASFIE